MAVQKLTLGSFMGETMKTIALDGFTLSLTKHNQMMKVPNHEHEYPYISLLLYGHYQEKSCVSEQDIVPGYSLFRPNHYEHTNEIGDNNSLCFNIEIQKDIFQGSYKSIKDQFFHFERNNLEILKIQLGFQKNESSDLMNLHTEENLYLLFQHYLRDKYVGRASWLNKIKKEVRFYPEKRFTINEVADFLHIHPIYFVRKFKEATGLTFGEYLVRQRLSKSIDLMLSSSKKLTEVALESGFYDQSHFIRHFKETFKVSPSQYRRVLKG